MYKEFDSNGLRHSMQELQSLGKDAVFLNDFSLSDYVDLVTKTAIDNRDEGFILKFAHIDPDKIALSPMNATSFGNLAYIRMYCHHKPACTIADQILERARNFFFSNNQ